MEAQGFFYDGFALNSSGGVDYEDDDGDDDEEGFLPWGMELPAGAEEGSPEDQDVGEPALPKMPEEFYNGVEQFLSKSPPRLKSKKRLEVENATSILGGAKGKIGGSAKTMMTLSSSGVFGGSVLLSQQGNGGGKRVIDPSLLNEAFAYTEKIVREAALMESQEAAVLAKQQRRAQSQKDVTSSKPRSAGSVLEKSAADYGKIPKSSAAKDRCGAGLVKRLRQSTQTQAGSGVATVLLSGTGRQRGSESDFSVTAKAEDDSTSRKMLDFDSLVANFQQGLTLRKLQAELAASQTNMKKSATAFRELAGKGLS